MARRVPIERWTSGGPSHDSDWLAEEAPLAIDVVYRFKDQSRVARWGITLRTPGQDAELALGLLFSEGRIESIGDIVSIEPSDGSIRVTLAAHVDYDPARARLATAACGFCGSADLPSVEALGDDGFRLSYAALEQLPRALHLAQPRFHESGATHAAALFGGDGVIGAMQEDIGRHNAVDKLIGEALREGRVPLSRCGLLLSGRAGYELLQKAAHAGIPFVAAIGAPSTLSVDVARAANITLAGFVREGRANVYTGTWRVV
ncbi:MAG: formate dehydrogenase accessory sulfurtransferase FdhD [Acidobacteria bacterium]|nr:formate dehydrogenase accessory sulfurtransferase FdhD [Acidobacteriota bacterium]